MTDKPHNEFTVWGIMRDDELFTFGHPTYLKSWSKKPSKNICGIPVLSLTRPRANQFLRELNLQGWKIVRLTCELKEKKP